MTNDEKEKIRQVFPNNTVIIKINPENPPTESTLTSAEWQVIMLVDGKKTLQDISSELSLSEDDGLIVFNNLYQKNLIEIIVEEETKEKFAGEEFFNQLEEILVKRIGPVAEYVINDVLWELNENREKFLIEKIPSLTESISQEILDETKKVQFQKEMLELIKKYEIY